MSKLISDDHYEALEWRDQLDYLRTVALSRFPYRPPGADFVNGAFHIGGPYWIMEEDDQSWLMLQTIWLSDAQHEAYWVELFGADELEHYMQEWGLEWGDSLNAPVPGYETLSYAPLSEIMRLADAAYQYWLKEKPAWEAAGRMHFKPRKPTSKEKMKWWDYGYERASYLVTRGLSPSAVDLDGIAISAVEAGMTPTADDLSICPLAAEVIDGARAYLADRGR